MKKNLAFIIASVFALSCAHHKGRGRGRTVASQAVVASAKAGNVMEARVNWLKDKSNKFDFGLTLTNSTEKGLIIHLGDIGCTKGKVSGEVKHTFFNTGERTIDFRPGQTKEFKLVCLLGTKVAAKDFKVVVRRISEDQYGDGRRAGKVLARNLSVPVTL